jgi:hypothetical protein
VRDLVSGERYSDDFLPDDAASGRPLTTAVLHDLLRREGWAVLDGPDAWDGKARGWHEYCSIDHEAHHVGVGIAGQLDSLVRIISDRIAELLAAGWRRVFVVTDHGWLLMPGKLPKTELHSVLAADKWGRCASLKPGVDVPQRSYPWHWNAQHPYVLASGVSCFKDGQFYSHGGLSLQECLTLSLEASGAAGAKDAAAVWISRITWTRLRCAAAIEGGREGMSLDIRTSPDSPKTSAAEKPVPFERKPKDGSDASLEASLSFDDSRVRRDSKLYLVVLDESGEVVSLRPTTQGKSE